MRANGGEGKRKRGWLQENWAVMADFRPTLCVLFSPHRSSKDVLFIGSGRGQSCICWGKISALDSAGKHLNRWLKVIIIRLLKANPVSLFRAVAVEAAVEAINQQELC